MTHNRSAMGLNGSETSFVEFKDTTRRNSAVAQNVSYLKGESFL